MKRALYFTAGLFLLVASLAGLSSRQGVLADSATTTASTTDVSTASSSTSTLFSMASGTPDTLAPTMPTGLTATAVSPSEIHLLWNPSTDNVGTAGYVVFRNGSQIATPSSTTFSDMNLSPGASYSYMVSAFDAASNGSALSAVATATTTGGTASTTPPSSPVNGSALGWALLPSSVVSQLSIPTASSSGFSPFANVNGYPQLGGSYVDCSGTLDNDPAHHTTDMKDTDPAHHIGQNCPGGMPTWSWNNMWGSNTWQGSMSSSGQNWTLVPLTTQTLQSLLNWANTNAASSSSASSTSP